MERYQAQVRDVAAALLSEYGWEPRIVGVGDPGGYGGWERIAQTALDAADHQGAVEALVKLADLHHRTVTGSKKHDPENRDWAECECESCRLAQPYAGRTS